MLKREIAAALATAVLTEERVQPLVPLRTVSNTTGSDDAMDLDQPAAPVVADNSDVSAGDRTDLSFQLRGNYTAVDVSVVHVNTRAGAKSKDSCQRINPITNRRFGMEQLAAVEKRADEKGVHYRPLLEQHRGAGCMFVPFVLTSYGNLNWDANTLLYLINQSWFNSDLTGELPPNINFRARLITMLSLEVQRGNAAIVQQAYQQLRQCVQPHVSRPLLSALNAASSSADSSLIYAQQQQQEQQPQQGSAAAESISGDAAYLPESRADQHAAILLSQEHQHAYRTITRAQAAQDQQPLQHALQLHYNQLQYDYTDQQLLQQQHSQQRLSADPSSLVL